MASESGAKELPIPSIRDRLLKGEPLYFQESDPDSARTLEGEWIVLAAAQNFKIEVINAIIIGSLQLRYAVLEGEFTLSRCQIRDHADFAYAIFKRNLDLSKTVFENGLDFHGATLEHDALWKETSIVAGNASFHDMHLCGVCVADWFSTGDGVEANFNRTHFDKTAFFLNSVFGGEASFRGVRFGDQAAFQGALFKSTTSFASSNVGHHALFRSEPKLDVRGPTFEGRVDFSAARISGQACFQDALFKKEAIFEELYVAQGLLFGGDPDQNQRAATFEGDAAFGGAEILRRADFNGVIFRQTLDLTGCTIEGNASFQGKARNGLPAAKCEGKVNSARAKIAGILDFRGVVFEDEVNFSTIVVQDNAIFSGDSQAEGRAAVFKKNVNFRRAQICGQADFRGTVFTQEVSFNLARLEQGAFFRHEPVRGWVGAFFGGATDFSHTYFGDEADFCGVTFNQDVNFNSAKIGGTARFYGSKQPGAPAAVFAGKMSFVGAQVKHLFMDGAKFRNDADFNSILVDGSATFFAAVFEGNVDFTSAHFGRDASFDEVSFDKQTIFNVARFDGDAFFNGITIKKSGEGDFRGAQFHGTTDFQNAVFEAPVDFYATHFDALGRFETARFRDVVSFRASSFRTLHFSDERDDAFSQFEGQVDMVGCTYEQVQVNWRALMAHIEPYDRQPYTQLETVFRTSGRDREADTVYLERQHRERRLRLQQGELGRWLFSSVYRLMANYGVRPYRLLGAAVVLLAVGTYFFLLPGSVSTKDPRTAQGSGSIRLSVFEAFGVSLHQFLPVDVPLGAEWVPSNNYVKDNLPGLGIKLPTPLGVPAFFATLFLRLAGWILVPLGVAALTGVLRFKT